jgi:hypothetical protein
MTPLARLLASCACFILALAVVSASATSIGDAPRSRRSSAGKGPSGAAQRTTSQATAPATSANPTPATASHWKATATSTTTRRRPGAANSDPEHDKSSPRDGAARRTATASGYAPSEAWWGAGLASIMYPALSKPVVIRACCALALASVAMSTAGAQTIRAERPDPTCRCAVVLTLSAELGRARDTVAVSERSFVTKDSRGFFYAAPIHPQGTVARFDRSGAHVGTVGRAGSGPGELSSVQYVTVTPGDSVLVMEHNRLSLFSPEGLFARAAALPGGVGTFRVVVLSDGRMVLNNFMPARRSFTLLDQRLSEVRTFGRSIAGRSFPDSDAMQFLIVPLDSGRFAAVQQNHSFLVQVWDTAGRLVRELKREPEWFTPWTTEQRLARTPRDPPFVRVMGAHVDLRERHLWITALVPDRRWQDVAPRPEPGRREVPGWLALQVQDYPRAFDTIIEILDLDSGRVVVSQRFDEYVPHLLPGGFLYGLREESSGLFVVGVWQARVDPRR